MKRETLKEGHWSFLQGGHSRRSIDRDHLLSDPVAASPVAYALPSSSSPSTSSGGHALHLGRRSAPVGGFLDPKAKVAYATPSHHGPTLASQIEDLVRGKRVLLFTISSAPAKQ